MPRKRQPVIRALPSAAGFTLAEVLVAMALLAIGIVGVAVALNPQGSGGVSSGADFGLAAISRGNSYSVATELAQARIEEIKNAPYTAATDQITSARFPDEPYGTIPGFPGFRRTVTIQNGVPTAGAKTVTVRVFFFPLHQAGQGQEEGVPLGTIIAQRP